MRKHILIALSLMALAIESPAGENQAVRTFIYPCRFTAKPILLDGKLDAEEWAAAVQVSGFTFSGKELLAGEQMVMRLLYDRDRLYLGVKCGESKMDKLVAKIRDHDGNVWQDDCIEIFFDPGHDHENYCQFIVNTLGAQYEAMGFDRLWNCEWKTAVASGPDSWSVEVAVPFAAFGVGTPAADSLWGFNLNRERNAGGSTELYNWADVQGNFHNPGLFGHLWFLEGEGTPDENAVASVARRVGGAEARLYVADGYIEVKQGQNPKLLTYRDLIQTQRGAIAKRLGELEPIYREHPDMILKDSFEKLRARYEAIRNLASGERPVSAEESAGANAFLLDMEDAIENVYWRVRVRMLLDTM